ncbi:MAG: hypothetical protein J5641_01310, partial [Bacteroidales bacterium]|nr:hypothetical protein [Bacteroidales bacterium]
MKKKIVLLVLSCVMCGIGTQAQRPVNDTLWGTDSTYMYYLYDWWQCANGNPEAVPWGTFRMDYIFYHFYMSGTYHTWIDDYYNGPMSNEGHAYAAWMEMSPGNNIRGLQMFTDHPIKVVGIAACAYAEAARDTSFGDIWRTQEYIYHPELLFPNQRDTTLAGRITDSLRLYDVGNGTLNYLAGGPWRVESPHRYLPLPPLYNYTNEQIVDSCPIVPLYEVMLDKPQVVTDSFVVAGTAFNNDGDYLYESIPGNENWGYAWMWRWNHPPTRYWSLNHISRFENGQWNHYGFPMQDNVIWFKYRSTPWMRSGNLNFHWFPLCFPIFPIIDPDFDTVLCDVVSNVHLADKTDSSLTLMWNGGNNVEW